MKQSKALLVTAAVALAIAGCRQADDSSNAAANGANSSENASIETLPPSEDAAPPAATNDTANEAVPAAAIPAAFQGRWGMVPGDCTSTRGDNKGLITVDSDSIKFYESRATLAKVTMNAPENFTGDFNFSGEGQTWTKSQNLKLTGSSNTLIRSETGPAASYTYKRC